MRTKVRRCRERDCDTVLSAYNQETTCWVHTERRVVRRRVNMSNAFLSNVPGAYEITAAEGRDLQRGTG